MILDVQNLDRHALLHSPADCRVADVDMTIPDRRNNTVVHSVGGAKSKFLAGFIEDIDCASLGVGELRSLGDDGGKDSLEVDARIHCLGNLAKGAQFAD